MPRLDPQPGQQIKLDTTVYTFTPHPVVASMAFGQEGRKAIVYQLRNNSSLYALKIFKPQYHDPSLVDTCRQLATIAIPGLEVCARQCMTRAAEPSLITQYPEVEFAVLMPWIHGSTWFDVVFSATTLSQDACKTIARNTAEVLAKLEERGYAHCDIAGGNVVVDTMTGKVSFIDVEDMYGPNLPDPRAYPQGTEGYQHRTSRTGAKGQWCAAGDRFSAAVLLAEMLAWHNPKIRQLSDEEHFFKDEEMQEPTSPNYQLIVGTLRGLSKKIADLFEQAWHSTSLADCSPLSEWVEALEFPLVKEWTPVIAPPPPAPYRPQFEPIKVPVSVYQVTRINQAPVKPGTPPDIPPFFRHSPGDHTLQWFSSRGAEEYEIQVAEDEKFSKAAESHRVQGNVWKIPDAFRGTKYFRILATNSAGSSGWSNTVIVHCT